MHFLIPDLYKENIIQFLKLHMNIDRIKYKILCEVNYNIHSVRIIHIEAKYLWSTGLQP